MPPTPMPPTPIHPYLACLLDPSLLPRYQSAIAWGGARWRVRTRATCSHLQRAHTYLALTPLQAAGKYSVGYLTSTHVLHTRELV